MVLQPDEAFVPRDNGNIHRAADALFRCRDVALQVCDGNQTFGHIRHIFNSKCLNRINKTVDVFSLDEFLHLFIVFSGDFIQIRLMNLGNCGFIYTGVSIRLRTYI